MYESFTFPMILQRMLARVPETVDKREGSVIYDACAGAAAELAQMYIQLDVNYNLSFIDTTAGVYLTRRCAEFGVNREPAAPAKRKGLFYDKSNNPFLIPAGSRFAIENLAYVAVSPLAAGQYSLACETAGAIGNQKFGPLLPIDYIEGLARAELAEVLIPGEDEETDDALRARCYETVNNPPFGGNIADYRQTVQTISGVGGVKVFPVWNGGGTVKCTLIGSDWQAPSSTLIDTVQTAVDPAVNGGAGYGSAPIGHEVTIAGVQEADIAVETTVTLAAGLAVDQVQGDIEAAIAAYLLELRQDWSRQEQLTVRVSQIEARVLTAPGVEDVSGTQLNGAALNIALDGETIPVPGTVTVHA